MQCITLNQCLCIFILLSTCVLQESDLYILGSCGVGQCSCKCFMQKGTCGGLKACGMLWLKYGKSDEKIRFWPKLCLVFFFLSIQTLTNCKAKTKQKNITIVWYKDRGFYGHTCDLQYISFLLQCKCKLQRSAVSLLGNPDFKTITLLSVQKIHERETSFSPGKPEFFFFQSFQNSIKQKLSKFLHMKCFSRLPHIYLCTSWHIANLPPKNIKLANSSLKSMFPGNQ